ncbi:MAG: hypothetical protein JNG88_09635 [Phycisphaerales bacterium]|nr:hypothetical protein [Phycisphaerales bacterium]
MFRNQLFTRARRTTEALGAMLMLSAGGLSFGGGAPSNDNCAEAETIANRGTALGDLNDATPDGAATCGSSNGNRDLWYRFTAPPPGGIVVLDTCGSRNTGGANAGADTVLSVYSDCVGTELACNDDGGLAGCSNLDSRVIVPVASCQTIWIRVSHFGTDPVNFGNGLFELHVNLQYCIRADANCDGLLNNFDIDCFVLALSNGEAAWESICASPQHCGYVCAIDANDDGLVNNFDIDMFVQVLSNGACP